MQSGDIERWIEQLGSRQFSEREAASRQLQTLGETARAALETAAVKHEDPEIRRRATRLIDSLDQLSIQGAWECQSESGPRLLIRNRQIIFQRGSNTLFQFTLAPLSAPAQRAIHFLQNGRVVLVGICALQRDALQLCLPIRDNLKQPATFARDGDPDFITFQFHRLR
jgi:hypothetical protein